MKIRNYHRDSEVAAISYMIIKEQGICVRCQANWAEQGRVHCWGCAEYTRLQYQRRRKQKRAKLVLVKNFKSFRNFKKGKSA